LLSHLPVPEFYDPDRLAAPASQEQLRLQMQRGQYALPILKAKLENQLLAESGCFVSKSTGREFNFPPCKHGEKCVGMTHRLRGQTRGFIFTMVMMDTEYEYFCQTGKAPEVSRP